MSIISQMLFFYRFSTMVAVNTEPGTMNHNYPPPLFSLSILNISVHLNVVIYILIYIGFTLQYIYCQFKKKKMKRQGVAFPYGNWWRRYIDGKHIFFKVEERSRMFLFFIEMGGEDIKKKTFKKRSRGKKQNVAFPYGDWWRGYLEKNNTILMKIAEDKLKTKQIFLFTYLYLLSTHLYNIKTSKWLFYI